MTFVQTRTIKTITYSSSSGTPKVTTNTTNCSSSDPMCASRRLQISQQRRTPQAPPQSSNSRNPRPATRKGAATSGSSSSYDDVKRHALQSGGLWEDPDFTATNDSLFFSRAPPRPFVWKRPKEICNNPKFISDGACRFDVKQGMLGDCWLLAAVSSLSIYPELFNQVVISDQSFDRDYCGVFRFRFWRFGEWVEVLVDDRLPTYNDQLVFMHSADANEFWSALLEKAFAKLNGSYESLKGGQTSDALTDFTGGMTEAFDLKKPPENLFQFMLKSFKRCSLMGCSIEAAPNEIEAKAPSGLVKGHAYSITGVNNVHVHGRSVGLIRIRNPWGNEREWTGAWSDKSSEWRQIDDAQKREIGLTFDDDGEFWMEYKDFISNFDRLEICNLGPQSLDSNQLGGKAKVRFESNTEVNKWKKGVSAGGCRNFIDTFSSNPQFRVNVIDADEDDDNNKGTLIVGLMQKDRRKLKEQGYQNLTIGFAIYKLDEHGVKEDVLNKEYFMYHKSDARSHSFVNAREVCGRFQLDPGTYCIIPSTFNPNEEGEFVLRLFSEKPNSSQAMEEQTKIIPHKPIAKTQEDDAMIAKFQEIFNKISGDDMQIDAKELKNVLNAMFRSSTNASEMFQLETCRSIVALYDADQSGKLGFDEFKTMFIELKCWNTKFKVSDKDNSGKCNMYELRNLLRSIGYSMSTKTMESIMARYSDVSGNVDFDDFVMIAIRMKTIYENFEANFDSSQNVAKFDRESFFNAILYI